MQMQGTGVSEGIGIGSALILKETIFETKKHQITDINAEEARLDGAVAKLTVILKQRIEASTDEQAEIMSSHLELLSDPALIPEIKGIIRTESCNCEYALDNVFEQFIEMFAMSEDELLQLRATDLRDIRQNLLMLLNGQEPVDISQAQAGTVLAANELSTSVAAGIRPDRIAGIVTNVGGPTAHMAIIARSLGVPAVAGVAIDQITAGAELIVDGRSGLVIQSPSADEEQEYRQRQDEIRAAQAKLEQYRGMSSETADKISIELCANVGLPADIEQARKADAEGIGLFRTEFLYMDRPNPPGEEEQFAAYRKAAVNFAEGSVIIRTLDVGGDKEIPYLGIGKEESPFLGYRAIRYCLEHPEIFRTQLRAILRASAYGKVKIMIPMISTVTEFLQSRELVEDVKEELDGEGIEFDPEIQVGMMIETPAAAVMADVFAVHADFFSIGTNDLTQYMLSVDRGNQQVAGLYSTYDPAVLRMIFQVAQAAEKAGIMCGICGEAGSDPLLTQFLIGCGIREISVTSGKVLALRKQIHAIDAAKAKQRVKDHLLQLTTVEEAAEFLKQGAEM